MDKKGAIGRLGFGVVDKVFVEFEQPPPQMLLAFDAGSDRVPRWMRRTAGIMPVNKDARVIHVWMTGKDAVEMEEMEEEEVVSGVHATMGAFGCVDGRVVGMRRSGWGRDPLFMGSYSYMAVWSSGEDFDKLAEPVMGLRVMFAGEATHRSYYSTTHGAFLSGVREAERLLQLYRRRL